MIPAEARGATSPAMVRLCWEINGRRGQGSPVDRRTGESYLRAQLAEHGPGTHWLEDVGPTAAEQRDRALTSYHDRRASPDDLIDEQRRRNKRYGWDAVEDARRKIALRDGPSWADFIACALVLIQEIGDYRAVLTLLADEAERRRGGGR